MEKEDVWIGILTEEFKRCRDMIEEGSLHPRRAIYRLREVMFRSLTSTHELDLLNSALYIGFIATLFDRYFDKKIDVLTVEEMDKLLKEEEHLPDVTRDAFSMLKRELQSLNFSDHFDIDYVLRLNTLKEHLTSFDELKGVFTDDVERILLQSISRAVEKILEELKEKVRELINSSLEVFEKEKTIKALENVIYEYVKKFHEEIYSWPR